MDDTTEPMSLDAIERDLQRTITRLQDAIASHDPDTLTAAVRSAEPAIKRVRAALDEHRSR